MATRLDDIDDVHPETVHVTARLPDGNLKATWQGSPLLWHGGEYVIAARWARGPVTVGPLSFQPGDVLVEFFSERLWFNVFGVWDPQRREQRGWYVNVARPVQVARGDGVWQAEYTDLALDFVVTRERAVELDTAAWDGLLGQLPAGQREQAVQAATALRRQLLEGGPQAAWTFLQDVVTRPALDPEQRKVPEVVGRYGVPLVVDVELDWSGQDLDHWCRLQQQGERDAEAIYVLRLPAGRTLVHTKSGYPPGVFRLPGGGVARRECPAKAAVREAREETGLAAQPLALLAYARFTLRQGARALVMPNYVFLLAPENPRCTPKPSAEEGITELRTIPWRQLADLARELGSLGGSWASWGLYRAIPHLLAHRAIDGDWRW